MKFLKALFMDTSLTLSMTRFVSITKLMTKRVFGMTRQVSITNSGFCLKMTDKENALCHLARTDIFTQIAFKNLKNSTQRSQNDTF